MTTISQYFEFVRMCSMVFVGHCSFPVGVRNPLSSKSCLIFTMLAPEMYIENIFRTTIAFLTDREFTVNVPAVAKEWSSVITRGTVLKSTIDPPVNTGCSILIFPLVDTCTDLKCQRRFGTRKNVSAF